jgi:hypothetical protein
MDVQYFGFNQSKLSKRKYLKAKKANARHKRALAFSGFPAQD